MRFTYLRTILILLANCAAIQQIQAADTFADANRQRDFEAVQQFVNSRRTIPFYEKASNIKFSGDIRADYYNRYEYENGVPLRGGGSWPRAREDERFPFSHNVYEAVLNWQVDYKCERAWAQAKMQHDNTAGIQVIPNVDRENIAEVNQLFGSGTCDDSCLKRAFFGYRILDCPDNYTLDVEIGRRQLNHVFESYIEFKSRFEGIIFKYTKHINKTSRFYLYVSPFIVDFQAEHYGFVGEAGIINLWDKKIDARLSYIDWVKSGINRYGVRNPRGALYRIPQVSVDYNLPEIYKKPAQLYGAFLVNTAATKIRPRAHTEDEPPEVTLSRKLKRGNIGWYAGFLMGEVRKTGDWAIDISYEYVQIQAIPDSDVSGIDRGNVLRETFTSVDRGKTNYKGWEFQYLYAFTPKLQANLIYSLSHAIDPNFGGRHSFRQFELVLIHAF